MSDAERSPRGRRKGALWAERLSAEVNDSRRYYDAAAAYVLLNPVRVKEPMVSSPEIYPWSSCAMTVGEGVTPAAYFERMVEKEGGVDAKKASSWSVWTFEASAVPFTFYASPSAPPTLLLVRLRRFCIVGRTILVAEAIGAA